MERIMMRARFCAPKRCSQGNVRKRHSLFVCARSLSPEDTVSGVAKPRYDILVLVQMIV